MSDQQLQVVKQPTQMVFNIFDPEQYAMLEKFCTNLAKSDLVPDMYKESEKNPLSKAVANAMIAVEMSFRTGANHLMVMQNLVVVHGRPSWTSKFLIATVQTCGRFDDLQYEIESLGMVGKVEYTDYVFSPQAGRKVATRLIFDGSEIENLQYTAWTRSKKNKDTLKGSPVDIVMAIKEGWYTKAGSKWQTMPRHMLMYRAASFWTSIYAPDISMGMRTVEENQDIEDIDHIDIPMDKPNIDINQEIKEKANKEALTFNSSEDNQQQHEPDNIGEQPLGKQEKRPF